MTALFDDFISHQEAATLMRTTPGSLAHERVQLRGPPYYKIGSGKSSVILYRRAEVLAWMREREASER